MKDEVKSTSKNKMRFSKLNFSDNCKEFYYNKRFKKRLNVFPIHPSIALKNYTKLRRINSLKKHIRPIIINKMEPSFKNTKIRIHNKRQNNDLSDKIKRIIAIKLNTKKLSNRNLNGYLSKTLTYDAY